MIDKQHFDIAIRAAIDAGEAILDIYKRDFDIKYKQDESPLTEADTKANQVIMRILENSGIPVLSEEGRNIPYEERKNWNCLWIVDPLDGTKEFIKKNDEFTVNIALVEKGTPIFGVVYAPVLDQLFVGLRSVGAWKLDFASHQKELTFSELQVNGAVKLPVTKTKNTFGVVASRSHLSPETKTYIEQLQKKHNDITIMSKGSSLKICMVAEGLANVYPRFAPTSEWDTAAGHAVAVASGARMVKAENEDEELEYNKENILNPWFIVKR
jgi:3'(2'), 5'-bisphosphate nucleotidase